MNDPLSEALDALRDVRDGLCEENYLARMRALRDADRSIARLDALPDPYRVEAQPGGRGEWCYPDRDAP